MSYPTDMATFIDKPRLPAQLASGVYGREASVSAAEALGAALHGQPVQEVVS